MSVSLSVAASLVNMMLNAATTYTATPTDSRYYTSGISDAILSIDGNIIKLILGNANHGRRNDFQQQSVGITSPFKIPSHIGPLDPVQFVFSAGKWSGKTLDGTEYTIDEGYKLDQENLNPNINTNIRPHYLVKGGQIYHNAAGLTVGGQTCTVNLIYFLYSRTGAPQSPDEYYDAVVYGALSLLYPVEGELVEAARHFQMNYQQAESVVASGQPTVPSFRLIQQLAPGQQPETQ